MVSFRKPRDRRPDIIVTDAGAQDGSQSRVTDRESGRSLVVDNQADLVCAAIRKLRNK